MTSQHLIDLNDYHVEQWNQLIELAKKIKKDPLAYYGSCSGKLMATLFFEPSTRTQMSFQSAMQRLGGQLIGFDNPNNTSISKGENIKDTIKIISGYVDVIAMRHPVEGAAKAASLYANCPIINAGDGGHLHPTQTLTDLLTLSETKGRLDHLVIGLCGDLKYGRTVHSLIKAMSQYKGNHFILISTKELRVPDYMRRMMDENGCSYEEVTSLEEAISSLDVLYMTRIQRERFASLEEYERLRSVYILDPVKMRKAKADLRVLHPLPRVDEIDPLVDDDPRAVYFDQAIYGMYIRMALIYSILHGEFSTQAKPYETLPQRRCQNPGCISNYETYLPHIYHRDGSEMICAYCDHR